MYVQILIYLYLRGYLFFTSYLFIYLLLITYLFLYSAYFLLRLFIYLNFDCWLISSFVLIGLFVCFSLVLFIYLFVQFSRSVWKPKLHSVFIYFLLFVYCIAFIYFFIHIFLVDPPVFIQSFVFYLFFFILYFFILYFLFLYSLFLYSSFLYSSFLYSHFSCCSTHFYSVVCFLLICFFFILHFFIIYFFAYLLNFRQVFKTSVPFCSLQRVLFAVCDMCQREGNDADVPLWSPRRVPEVLREDDPDGRIAASVAPALRHLSCQDTTTKAERDGCRRRPSSDVGVALFCGQQVLGRPQLSFQLHQVGCTWFRVQLLRWKDLGCPQFGVSVLHG